MYHSEIVKSVVKNLEETQPCPLVEFEPTIPAIELPQAYFLDRPAKVIGHCFLLQLGNYMMNIKCWLICTFLLNACMHHVHFQQNNSLSHSA